MDRLVRLAYFVAGGMLSMTVGAAASLAAPGPWKLAVWPAVSGLVAFSLGFAADVATRRLVRCLGGGDTQPTR